MTDPISSSKWTGPLEQGLARPRFGAFSHRLREPTFTSDYARFAEAARVASLIPPEVRGVIRVAVFLFVSPAALWIAWWALRFSTRDMIARDNSHVLIIWGLGVVALAASQMLSRSVRLIGLRKATLWLALLATMFLSAAYFYLGVTSHENATALAPERTFELYKSRGRGPFRHVIFFHQRANGSFVEGSHASRPLDYASTCALVQRIDGEHGFSWVRVIGRSRAPARGQLSWPVRREECFSDIPLSALPS